MCRHQSTRDSESISLAQARDFARLHRLSILPEYEADKGWIRCQVDPRRLRNIYGCIGPFSANKGELFEDMAERVFSDTAVQDSDFAAKVLVRRSDKAVVVYRSTSGNLYVGDGNKRALNACIHDEEWIDAILVAVDVRDWTDEG